MFRLVKMWSIGFVLWSLIGLHIVPLAVLSAALAIPALPLANLFSR